MKTAVGQVKLCVMGDHKITNFMSKISGALKVTKMGRSQTLMLYLTNCTLLEIYSRSNINYVYR